MKGKKILSVLAASALIAPLALCFTGCKKAKKFDINAKDVYAISAVSSVNYLMNLEEVKTDTQNTATRYLDAAMESAARPSSLTDSNIESIKDCLELFDSVIESGKVNQATAKNNDPTGEFATYTFVMTINLPGMNESFKMYYNEVETETNRKVEDEKEEVEVSTTLEGVMAVGETRFDMTGKREFEQEGNEKESSIEFTTKSRTNSQNYVVIKQSVEEENGETELEYEYQVYNNGTKVLDLETEIEFENDKIELEFKLKNVTSGMLEETLYKITKGSAEGIFNVSYTINNTTDTFVVKKTTTGYTFTYSNNFSEEIKF